MRRVFSILFLLIAFRAGATVDSALQMQLGNPSGATANTNNHDHYLIQRTVEALDYSDNLGQPNWAAWDLTASDIGTNARSSFITDTNLPPNFTRYSTSIYNNAGWDRGHLCPSKDRTDTSTNNDLVFYISNVLPQSGVNNSGVWLQFENYCRDLVQSTNNYELLLICGGSGYGSARLTNGPFIPDYVWKIAVVVPSGLGVATNRITTTNRVIAIKIANNDSATNTWPTYVTSARQIEVDTGFTFFTALPAIVSAALRDKVDGQTNPPPVIFTFSPTNGNAGDNVAITGTNFSSASAVTFGGIPATFSVNSGTQVTATVPTNGSTGLISVTTPSGTAVSSNTFLVNGGVTVFSGTLVGWDVSTLTGGNNNYGASPLTPTTNAFNLTTIGLTRGSGIVTNGNAAAQAWGGLNYTNLTAASAVASNRFVTFSVAPNAGYKVSFTSVSRFDYRRSATGPTNGVLQYQLNAGTFTDITNLNYAVFTTGGGSIGAIDLSGVTALQNVVAGTNVTFRIVNFLGTGSTGSWYLSDVAGSSAPDLALQGTVTSIVPLGLPTLTIQQTNSVVLLSWPTAFTGFVLQQNTDLRTTNWTAANFTLSTNGSTKSVMVSPTNGNNFFRLVKP